jgi:polyisoprenoid-binding protein YceI
VSVRRGPCARAWCAAAGLLVLGWAQSAPACELPPASNPRFLLRVDDSRSAVAFDAKAFLHSFTGRTSRIRGTVALADPESPDGAAACFRIDAASLETGNGTRDAIMRDDHLETQRFPSIAFDLTQVERARRTADGWEFLARGALTLRDVARQTQFVVRARRDGNGVRLTGEVPVKMTDHGVPVPKFLFLTVEDPVLVRFDVTAIPAP